MKLWRSLLGRNATTTPEIARYSLNDYANDISFAFNGQRYILSGGSTGYTKTEDIEASFTGYIQQIYKSNGVVFAIILSRMLLFSEARFCWFDTTDNGENGRPAGREGLEVLERPWPNASTGELLSRMEQDVSLGGNFYAAREPNRLRRLRPDWLTIVLTAPPAEAVESDVAGYWYHPGRVYSNAGEPAPGDEVYLPDEICHFSPIPDPDAQYRGMSWLSPVVREVMADKAATDHKLAFFANGAQLGVIISAKENLTNAQFKEWKENFANLHTGTSNAYKSLFLASPVDASVTTANMQQLDFKVVQGSGETRLCAAGGVPPIIVGLSEGLASSTYSNYGMARRKFGDGWAHPQWRMASAALANVVQAPDPDLRLGVNTRGIAFLREDAKDLAEIMQIQASAVSSFITAGYEPDSCTAAVDANDLTLLKHTGLTSVQLMPPGSQDTDGDGTPDAEAQAADEYQQALEEFRAELAVDDEIVRKFNPGQPRAAWVGGSGGQWAATGLVRDALKLAGRADLESGETLVGSDKVKTDNATIRAALSDRAGVKSLRLGIGGPDFGGRDDEAGPWRGGPDRSAEENARRAPLVAEMRALENAPDTPENDRRYAELNDMALNDVYPSGYTARLNRASVERLRSELSDGLKVGAALQAEFDAMTDEEFANAPEHDYRLAEGTIPGEWADVHYRVELDDPGVGVIVYVAAVPHDSDVTFDDLIDNEAAAPLDPSEAAEFLRLLGRATGDVSRSHIERRYYDIRVDAGHKGGGRFRRLGDIAAELLNKWLSGDGEDDDPLKQFTTTAQLRKIAEQHGIAVRPRMSVPALKLAILDDAKARFRGAKDAKAPEVGKPVRFTLSGGDPKLAREVEVENKIRAAYRAAQGPRKTREWVSLAEIRDELSDLSREEQDQALDAIRRQDGVRVVPVHNTKGLTDREFAARLQIAGGTGRGGTDLHAISIEDPSPRPVPKSHRDLDVGVFTEGGKVALWEVSDSGERKQRVALADDLAGLATWAEEHGESELAGWATKERGAPKGAPQTLDEQIAEERPRRQRFDEILGQDRDGYTRFGAEVVGQARGDFGRGKDPREIAVRLRRAADDLSHMRLTETDVAVNVEPGQAELDKLRDYDVGRLRRLADALAAQPGWARKEQGGAEVPAKAARKSAKKAAPKAAPPLSTDPAVREVEVENKIRAYFREHKILGGWASIAGLRDSTPDVDRAELDTALQRLAVTPGVQVIPWDNTKALSQADRDAALRFGGQNNHAFRFEDPSPRPLPAAKPSPKQAPAKVAKKAAPATALSAATDRLRVLVQQLPEGRMNPDTESPQTMGLRALAALEAGDEQGFVNAATAALDDLKTRAAMRRGEAGWAATYKYQRDSWQQAMKDARASLRTPPAKAAKKAAPATPAAPGQLFIGDLVEGDGLDIFDAPHQQRFQRELSGDAARGIAPTPPSEVADHIEEWLAGPDGPEALAARLGRGERVPGIQFVPGYDSPEQLQTELDNLHGKDRMWRGIAARLRTGDSRRPSARKATPAAAPDLADLRTLDTEARRDALDLRKVGTVDDPDSLKGMLKAAGLPVSGKKRELVDRLVEHLGGGKAPKAAPAARTPLGPGGADDLAEEFYRHPNYTGQQIHDRLAGLNLAELKKVATATNVALPRDLVKTEAGPVFQPLKKISADELRDHIAATIARDRKLLKNDDAQLVEHLGGGADTPTALPAPTRAGSGRTGRYDLPAGVTPADADALKKALKRNRGRKEAVADMPGGDNAGLVERLDLENNAERILGNFQDENRALQRMTTPQMQQDLARRAKEAMADRQVAINVGSETLEEILRDGRFKTQLETNTSSGVFQPDVRRLRENVWFGLSEDTDPAERPIYGYLMTRGSGKKLVDVYGDVRVVLKPEVRTRTTAAIGDTMENILTTRPAPVDDPDWYAFNINVDRDVLDKVERNYDGPAFNKATYLEAQVHGGVTLDDIEEIVLSTEPSPELRAALKARGLKWRVIRRSS